MPSGPPDCRSAIDVADAFARIEDPAERVRLAFKLFDSEGVALVNLLSDGSDALEEMRDRARDLGIVLDEALVRDAERARTELDTLSQVISANLTRAALEAAPVIADLSSWLADAGMPMRKFIAALTIGSVLTAFAFAAIGAGWANQPILALVMSYVLPILLLPIALYLIRLGAQ